MRPVEPPPTKPLLKEAALRELCAAGMVGHVLAKGIIGGFMLEISISGGVALLTSSRGEARTFASIATLCLVLRKMGVNMFMVDATNFKPGRIRAAQPERSTAMKAGRLPKAVKAEKSGLSQPNLQAIGDEKD